MINISSRCCCALYMIFTSRITPLWKMACPMNGAASFVLLVLIAVLGFGLPATTWSNEQIPTESKLRTLFEKLKMKRNAVGGVVLRGDTEYTGARHGFLDLSESDLFTVLPGVPGLRLMWKSDPHQNWELSLFDRQIQVQGGQIDVHMPALSEQGIYSWSLRRADKPQADFTGNWFYLQNVDSTDGRDILTLLEHLRGEGASNQAVVGDVCQWMRSESLIHQNEHCIHHSTVLTR